MGMNLLIYIEKILDKLQSILHTLAGWVVAVLLFLADFIVGHELAVGLVVFVTLMDTLWGITVSIKKKRFALSELARLTIGKLAVYGCAFDLCTSMDGDGAVVDKNKMWNASNTTLHHPNVAGSLAMFAQTLIDVPEIYG